MGKSSYKEKRLAGQVSLALAAGMFSALPVAHGMPTLDPAAPHTGGTPDATAIIDANDANKMNVTGTRANNVVDWIDFSIANGETVAFQDVGGKSANYMNIVTGKATSNIQGAMTNNGDIYLINPNGVIFGATAQVNVGNLYVSTREASQEAIDTFRGVTESGPSNDGTILAALTVDNALKSDVVNLIDNKGYVKANKVIMEGNNIRFLNTSAMAKQDVVTDNGDGTTTTTDYVSKDAQTGIVTVAAGGNLAASNIILRKDTDGYIHVGDTNSADGKYTAQTIKKDDQTSTYGTATGVDYKVVRDKAGLSAINSNLSGNYMLANNITNAGSVQIGTGVYDINRDDGSITSASQAFSGKFDGMFFTVSELNQEDVLGEKYLGLFGFTQNARIENVGIANANLKGWQAGGLAGYADHTTFLNVWNAGGTGTIGSEYTYNIGGVVGYAANGTSLTNAYNAAEVYGAGLVSNLMGSSISNAYNIGKLHGEGNNPSLNGIYYYASSSTITNVYTASKYTYKEQTGNELNGNEIIGGSSVGVVPTNYYVIGKDISAADAKKAVGYTFNSGISTEGGSGYAWRIYEGYSLPLLTAFFKGTVATDYSYNTIAADSTTATESLSAAYDFSQFKTDYSANPVTYSTLPSKTYDAAAVGPTSVKYYGMNADGTGIMMSDNKDAKTFALFYGGQQGYDLYGNNFTINKRNIKIGVNSNAVSKVYDGQSRNTVSGAGLLGAIVNADDPSKPGVIDGDAVTIGGKVTYVYNNDDGQGHLTEDKNFGAKKVTITTDGLTLTGASKDNYNANFTAPTQPVSADITKRTIQVGLYNTSGITKTYDGTAKVTNENKGDRPHGFVGAENIDTSALTNVDGDADWLENQFDTHGDPLIITIAGMLSDDGVGFNTSGVTSRYVQSDLATDAVNVADVAKVAYEGIALTGSESALANYQLSNDGAVYADGSLTKRNISSADLGYDSSGSSAITKVYDGLETMSGGTAQDVTVGNQVAKGTTSTHTGLIEDDATSVQFATTGTATFYLSNGTTPTANATNYKGDGTGAQIVKYNVALKATNATTANYTVDGNNLNTTTTYGVEGTGTITKRAIAVELVRNYDLDKTYNGTADLDAGTAANYASGSIAYNAQTQAFAQTGNLKYAQGSGTIAATDTGVNISITNAAYADENVAYDYDGSGNVTDKNIAYTVAFNNTDAAYNYTLNTVAGTTAPVSTTLTATGEISPKALTVAVSPSVPADPTSTNIDKVYDGNSDADKTRLVVSGWVGTDSQTTKFDLADVSAQYGNGSSDAVTFSPQTAVGNYDVKFSGLTTALKSRNYTISNTLYGRGAIATKHITLSQLEAKASPTNTVLTKVYDGGTGYDGTLNAADYLSIDYAGLGVLSSDVTSVTNEMNQKITIAQVIYGGKNVDSYTDNVTMTYNIGSSTGGTMDIGNYVFDMGQITKTTQDGQIDQRPVQVALNSNANPTKVYDGGNTLKANGTTIDGSTIKSWFTLSAVPNDEKSGIVSGEAIELDATALQGSYADAAGNAGSNQTVNYSGLQLTNTTNPTVNPASNYKLVNTSGVEVTSVTQIQGIGTISKRTITVANVGAVDRDYNGSALVTKTSGTNSAGAAYDDTIRITLNDAAQEGTSDWDVLYGDGLLDGANRASTTGLIKNVGSITGTYQNSADNEGSANVRRDSNNRDNILTKSVTYTGLLNALGGANGNYSIVDTATGQGTITPVKLKMDSTTVALPTVANSISRTYDATTAVINPNTHLTISNATIQEKYNSGVLLLDGASYNNKNVGENKTVTYKFKLNPEENINNYDLFGYYATSTTTAQLSSNVGKITPATIYGVVGASAAEQKNTISKVYDGYMTVEDADATTAKTWLTTNLAADGTGAVAITDEDGELDDVSILTTGVTLAYKDANVATSDANDKVTYSGLALTGEDAVNYQLASTTIGGYGTITPKSIAFAITVADGAYKKDYDGGTGLDGKLNGVDTTNSNTLTAAVTAWWNGVRATGDTTTFGNAFETDTGGNLVGYYGVWNPTTKTFTENPNVWANKSAGKKTEDVYYNLALKGAAAQNYEIATTGGTTGATINVNNTTIQDTVYFQDAMKGKGEIKPLAISMDKVKNEWGTFEKVYDRSTSVEGYLADGTATPTKEQQLTIYYDANGNGVRDKDANGDYIENVTIDYEVEAANYEDWNADNGKNIAYTGFSFLNTDLDNFVTTATDLEAKYADGEEATKTTGNIARRLLNVTPGTDNTKIYDGDAVLKPEGTAYNVEKQANVNDPTGRVGTDVVSVTYKANFDGKDATVDPEGNPLGATVRKVEYVYTLVEGGDSANYTLVENPANDDVARTKTVSDVNGAIKQREVYVDFKEGKDKGINKVYDNTSLIGEDIATLIALVSKDDTLKTGVIATEANTVLLNTGANGVTAHYVDKNGAASGDSDAKLGITTREVYFQNLSLTGPGAGNYVVKAKNHAGQVKKTATNPATTEQTLIGTGSIARRKIEVAVTDTLPTKEYDRTTDVLAPDRTAAYVNNGGRTLTKDDPYLKIADGVVDVSDGKLAGDEAAAYADADVTIESALYHDRNAQNGLGVTYKLKVNNQNYELVRYSIDTQGNKYIEGTGNIEKKTISAKDAPLVTKTYDGNSMITDTSGLAVGLFGAVEDGFANGVFKDDIPSLLKNISGTYISTTSGAASADTEADADSILGKTKNIQVSYTLNDDTNGSGKNYQFAGGTRSVTDDVHDNAGRIDRAALTLKPTPVTYNTGDAIPTNGYAGSVSGFKGNDALADVYNVTFGRDNNRSTAAGDYTLLGYVNGLLPTAANGLMYYNDLGNTGNYYFVQQPNQALHIVQSHQNSEVPNVVEEQVISDKKFTPDDYSYNRISQDPDVTRIKRESAAAVQYAEKGVNLDGGDKKSGLAALADIQGAGSVVNLNGALIQTSASAEQPERVAEAAALPVPETDEGAMFTPLSEKEENDISSIDFEYADNTSGSQSVLEILTNASSNAENKGTSIVIDTQDEDEEDAEAEKSRRAIFADRSNIGIETLGDAVNLNQMIG